MYGKKIVEFHDWDFKNAGTRVQCKKKGALLRNLPKNKKPLRIKGLGKHEKGFEQILI